VDQAQRTTGQTDMTQGLHVFLDRADAGRQVARRLDPYRVQDLLVLGLLGGGVPVAAEIARRFDAELDIIVARILRAWSTPDVALGAITANGNRYLTAAAVPGAGLGDGYLEAIAANEMAEARYCEERFRGSRPAPRIEDRTVIVVDDGLDTGATMLAALRALRKRQPGRLIVAAPVGRAATHGALRLEADEVVVLHEPSPFLTVGRYYHDFRPTQEREIMFLLQANWRQASSSRRPGEPVATR
jgi:putative phosphoribosyl transferase